MICACLSARLAYICLISALHLPSRSAILKRQGRAAAERRQWSDNQQKWEKTGFKGQSRESIRQFGAELS